jgi:hypothetical protein
MVAFPFHKLSFWRWSGLIMDDPIRNLAMANTFVPACR